MLLHSLLPSGTKRDKHSLILTAVQEVEELKKWREELEWQKSAMNKMLGARESSSDGSEMDEAKIRINVARPSSGVDSMLEVLKCLKQIGSNIRLIQSRFLPQQFSAVLGIETKRAMDTRTTKWDVPVFHQGGTNCLHRCHRKYHSV